MLTHYTELTAIPQAEMLQSEVMGFLVENIHKIIPKYEGRIALSFPAYIPNRSLGAIIRIFGEEGEIVEIFNKLQKLADYALIQEPTKIPEFRKFASFSRYRPKNPTNSALNRLEKRAKKRGINATEIESYKRQWLAKYHSSFMPFVYLKSSSTGQKMPLYIKMQEKPKAEEGMFNSYGLSQRATVPLF